MSAASRPGSAFNSIIQLELEQGRPRNPFINAGAIVVTDLVLAGHTPREAIGEILRFLRFLADDDDDRHRRRGRPIGGGDRGAQLCAGPVHARLSAGWSIRSTRCSGSISTTAPSP